MPCCRLQLVKPRSPLLHRTAHAWLKTTPCLYSIPTLTRSLHSTSRCWTQGSNAPQRVPANDAPPTPEPKPPSVPLPPKLAVRNILKDTSDLLRRVSPETDGAPWAERAEKAAEDLLVPRRARIALVGDRLSGARELVTALLEDPLAGNEKRKAVWSRWDDIDTEVLKIHHAGTISRGPDALNLPCEWLSRADADVYEINTTDPLRYLSLLLTVDTVLVVTDPTRLLTPLTPLLSHLAPSPSAPFALQLIINRTANLSFTSSPQEEDARLDTAMQDFYRDAPRPIATSVSSTLALEALEAFRSSAHPSPEAIRSFQEKSLASRISQLASSLSRPPPPDFQVQTATRLALSAVEAASYAVVEAEREVDEAKGKAAWLDSEVEAEIGRWQGMEDVKSEVGKSEVVVKGVLERLAWWKLPWKVDDVGAEMREAVERTYGRELERKVSFDSGRLEGVQARATVLTTDTLASFAPSSDSSTAPFHSPLLLNSIAQLTALTTLSSSSLLSPVSHRRTQLVQPGGPSDHLHLRAQNIVATAWIIGLGSPIAGYASWFGWGLESASAMAGVGLAWIATAWWSQGRWRKAGVRFWEDWERVGTGLEFDLKTDLNALLKGKVLAKPLAASEGIRELVARRETVLKPLRSNLHSLDRRLDDLHGR